MDLRAQCTWCPATATATVLAGRSRVRVCTPCQRKRVAKPKRRKPSPPPKPEPEPPEPENPCTKCQVLSKIADVLRSTGARVAQEHAGPGICRKCYDSGGVLIVTETERTWQECPGCAVAEAVKDSSLTPREQSVVVALVAMNNVKIVAVQLDISPATVRNHMRNTYKKLGIGSQPELFQWIYRRIFHRLITRSPETA